MPAWCSFRLFRCLGRLPMLRTFTEYIFALIDLIEAEVRSLRQSLQRAALGIGVLLVGGLLLATGLGFVIAALYLSLAATLNAWAGALITGGIVMVIGALIAWLGVRTMR